jgi:tetratricopeptide (TPR) repeat protein
MDHAGDIKFDYLLARVAMKTDHYSQAIYALERILMQKPNHAGARLDMAISYFHLGNYEYAKRELNTILRLYKHVAPKHVLKRVNKYLATIQKKLKKDTLTTSASYTSGYDSNVNIRSDYETVMGATLPDKIASNYQATSIGLKNNIKHSGIASSGYSLNYKETSYKESPISDKKSLYLRAYSKVNLKDWSITLAPSYTQSFLNEEELYKSVGASLSAQHKIDKKSSLTASFNQAKMNFSKSDMQSSDTDKSTLRLSYSKLSDLGMLNYSLSGTNEEAAVDENGSTIRADGDKHSVGVNASLGRKTAIGIFKVSVGYQHNQYQKTNTLFSVDRLDKKPSLSLDYNIAMHPRVVFSVKAIKSKSRSNIDLYTYGKDQISATFTVKGF